VRRSVVFTSQWNVVSIVLHVDQSQQPSGHDVTGSKFIVMYEGLMMSSSSAFFSAVLGVIGVDGVLSPTSPGRTTQRVGEFTRKSAANDYK